MHSFIEHLQSPCKHLGHYQLDATLSSKFASFYFYSGNLISLSLGILKAEFFFFLLLSVESWDDQISPSTPYEYAFFTLIPLLAFSQCLQSIPPLCSASKLCFSSPVGDHWNPDSGSQGTGKCPQINACTSVGMNFYKISNLCKNSFIFIKAQVYIKS